MYYDLIIFACFVKAMKEGRELANNCVFQRLSVFSITTSSQRNPRPTQDCNSSPTRYAQMLWPKLIFCYSDLRTLFNLCVTLMIVMVKIFYVFITVLPTPIRSTFLKVSVEIVSKPNQSNYDAFSDVLLGCFKGVLRCFQMFSEMLSCVHRCFQTFKMLSRYFQDVH